MDLVFLFSLVPLCPFSFLFIFGILFSFFYILLFCVIQVSFRSFYCIFLLFFRGGKGIGTFFEGKQKKNNHRQLADAFYSLFFPWGLLNMAFGTCCVVGRIFDEERKDVFLQYI